MKKTPKDSPLETKQKIGDANWAVAIIQQAAEKWTELECHAEELRRCLAVPETLAHVATWLTKNPEVRADYARAVVQMETLHSLLLQILDAWREGKGEPTPKP